MVTDDWTLAVADGEIAISAEEAAVYEPPSSSLRITCLPDAMYMAYPGDLRSSFHAMMSMPRLYSAANASYVTGCLQCLCAPMTCGFPGVSCVTCHLAGVSGRRSAADDAL